MATVRLPPVNAGDDARTLVARHRAALVEANGNLTCSRKWYGAVKNKYSVSQ